MGEVEDYLESCREQNALTWCEKHGANMPRGHQCGARAGVEGAARSLKDSGERLQFASGMVRDIESDKPAFELLLPLNVPYDEQMVTRVAKHLREGAKKYARRNWEKGNSNEEMERALASAIRHLIQLFCGETDEDHAAAAISNVIFAETMRYKIEKKGA